MSRVCLLTDNTAQFPRPGFPGRERVFVFPLDIEPAAPGSASPPRLLPPTPQFLLQTFERLSREYDSILTVTLSRKLHPAAEIARQVADLYHNHAAVEVIDSQTTSAGLGMLVAAAAGAAAAGASLAETSKLLRATLRHIYMLLCIPELTGLERFGLLNHTQALVGEIIGLMPILVMDDGGLTPLGKSRTQRTLLETFEDFMNEFTRPAHVALLRGVSQTTLRTRPLREFVQERFPDTSYSEHSLNPALTALFGTQTIGLAVMDTA